MYTHPIRPNELYHYGMPRRSGRYPWGSGERPLRRIKDKIVAYRDMKIKDIPIISDTDMNDTEFLAAMKAYEEAYKKYKDIKIFK